MPAAPPPLGGSKPSGPSGCLGPPFYPGAVGNGAPSVHAWWPRHDDRVQGDRGRYDGCDDDRWSGEGLGAFHCDGCVYVHRIAEPSLLPIVAHLRAALRSAMKARDHAALRAVRSALAAVDNASAVDGPEPTATETGPIAKAVGGLGAADIPRRHLTEEEATDIVRTEMAERRSAAADYRRLGQWGEAHRLEAEAAILESLLASAGDGNPAH